jgi:transglutaminase-like putative cysteine protease
MTLGILALTAGLFLILPRTANAALHFLASSRYHLTGFTSDVTLGETGKLQQDSRVVMHVRPLAVEGYSRASDLPLNLKWRGLALERFDGRRWSTDPGSFRPMPANGGLVRVAEDWQRRRRGKRILYRVEIQNIDADALFVAGAPEFVNVGQALLSRSTTGAFRFRFAPVDTLHYEVYSFLGPDIGPVEPHRVRLTAAERQADLAVPRLDPRIPELARRITSGASTDLERARLVEKYLRKIDYSLDLPADLPGNEPRDPVASFLFDWKKGYCEYFASSMAVMLRDLGIPARLVTGFQSGIQNPYSGSVVIRASDAHTWVEAFLPDAGWTVFDPTPPAASAAQQTLWTKLSLFLDAADTFWRDWVLRYDLGQQLTLASRVEAEARRIRRSGISNRTEWMAQNLAALGRWLSSAAVPIAIYVTALLLGWVAWRGTRGYAVKSRAMRGRTAPPEATLFYERMLHAMKQRGYQKPGWFTPQEFASSIPQPAGDDVERFTASYYAVRFGGDGAAARDMSAALEKLSAK